MYRGYLRVVDIDAFGDISADVAEHVTVPLKCSIRQPTSGVCPTVGTPKVSSEGMSGSCTCCPGGGRA
jgi:hypothetical protein